MLARAVQAQARVKPVPCHRIHIRCFHASPRLGRLRLASRIQSYISTSRDPYLNLSIEHHLLQKSSPESTILFLYTNRPCVVIGRNQNPWVEVNLPLLRASNGRDGQAPSGLGHIDIVRRRSGGGTVFHDEGNVNWSVICPPAAFTRDKHAEMVVRALRGLGVDRTRINERHDIVLDQEATPSQNEVDPEDTHVTGYTSQSVSAPRPLKVSGSAYKLTRARSLHHATCLLSSPNLGVIPQYLHSPARPYIKARGVESVSSPVANIGITQTDFCTAVRQQFQHSYGGDLDAIEVGEELFEEPAIQKGYQELRSVDWIYGQTPQFELSVGSISLKVRHGAVEAIEGENGEDRMTPFEVLKGAHLYKDINWENLNLRRSSADGTEGLEASDWLRSMLEIPDRTSFSQ